VLPHFPLIAPPHCYDLYHDLPAPRMYAQSERPDHPVIKDIARSQAYDKYFDDDKVKVARTAYFGMVSYLDHCIGRVLDTLDACGLTQETRVIYTTDHGDNIGHRGLWGKSNMYEESAAIPMLLAGADIPAGHKIATPVSLVDCYQTLIEGAGLPLTEEETSAMPGHSLIDIANDITPSRTILSEYHAVSASTGFFMIRNGDYKYVHYVNQPPQLFDLANDPHETNDLASDASHADVLSRCEQRLRSVVDPDAVNAQAFADQNALIERHGGVEAVLAPMLFFRNMDK
jgi:choline-sulfatase